MSNRRKTTEARIMQMGQNSTAVLQHYEALETNGVTLNSVDHNKRYKAYRRQLKARRLLDALRARQLAALQATNANDKLKETA